MNMPFRLILLLFRIYSEYKPPYPLIKKKEKKKQSTSIVFPEVTL